MVNQEKKPVRSVAFAPIIKGTLFGFFVVLIAVFIGATLMLNQVVSLEYLSQTAIVAVILGFFSAAFVTALSSKSKKLICGVIACIIMSLAFFLCGAAMPNCTFSLQTLTSVLISAAICSVIGSMIATIIKKK